MFDFSFAENGLTAYRLGQPLPSHSFLQQLGEERYQKLAKFCLRYISELEGLPAMRGTFVEFRTGMVNVSPVGRNASSKERNEFEAWDKKAGCRAKMVEVLKEEFPEFGLTYASLFSTLRLLRSYLLEYLPQRGSTDASQILYWRPDLIRRFP